MRHYQTWCAARGINSSPAAITAPIAGSWLASLGEGPLCAGTVRTYRSALSTHYEEALTGNGANPLQDPGITRLIAGIARAKLPADLARRRATPCTIELTADLIAQLEPYVGSLHGGSPQDVMRWAAACVGSYGMLRPCEFLGVRKDRSQALRISDVTFFARAGSQKRVGLCPPGELLEQHDEPDRFTLWLGATKADQLAENPPTVIAAAPAVQALWRWMHLRRDLGGEDGPVFAVPGGGGQLSQAELCRYLGEWIAVATDGAVPKVTGRAFRRGGASSMLASGAARADIQKQGRWKTASMVDVYSSAAAKQARAILDSRAKGPAASALVSHDGGAALGGRAGGAMHH